MADRIPKDRARIAEYVDFTRTYVAAFLAHLAAVEYVEGPDRLGVIGREPVGDALFCAKSAWEAYEKETT